MYTLPSGTENYRFWPTLLHIPPLVSKAHSLFQMQSERYGLDCLPVHNIVTVFFWGNRHGFIFSDKTLKAVFSVFAPREFSSGLRTCAPGLRTCAECWKTTDPPYFSFHTQKTKRTNTSMAAMRKNKKANVK